MPLPSPPPLKKNKFHFFLVVRIQTSVKMVGKIPDHKKKT